MAEPDHIKQKKEQLALLPPSILYALCLNALYTKPKLLLHQ